MTMPRGCPVCGCAPLLSTVKRARLPAMQNYVFHTRAAALKAPAGAFELLVCASCGFAFNAAFDGGLLHYDTNYNNAVPSAVMDVYYREIAEYLYQQYDLDGNFVVDVGCGKGTLLRILAARFNTVNGIGIDPSFEEEEGTEATARLHFIRDVFKKQYLPKATALLLCRHVVEHIPAPLSFLREIAAALGRGPLVNCFFEVPDLGWIIEQGAFWDFCHEHCNYFTKDSLAFLLRQAAFSFPKRRTAFSGQYLWAEAGVGGDQNLPIQKTIFDKNIAINAFLKDIITYNDREIRFIADCRDNLLARKTDGWRIVVWGMATKGVIFGNLIDPDGKIIDHCIDINRAKHGCFAPLTGMEIMPPESLKSRGQKSQIVVMNPTYAREIKTMCGDFDFDRCYIDARGNKI
ncbi:MAG: class I SAM-dependent methyltransferase [Chitinivibrionales bacterium]|nr:class I SAM-dependent methyltransferase [Chitinivibrionales bacterium]